MFSKFIRTTVAVIALVGVPGVALADSLGDALASAYKNSGLLTQNRALLRAADEGVAAATSALRPVVDYSISGSYSSVTASTSANFGLSASLLLFDFGATELRREVARENVMSLREALRAVEQGVLLRAASAYVSVQRDAAIVELRRNNVRLIEQELRAARDRFEVGEITRTDVALAEARLAGAKSALAAAEGALERARQEYRAAIGTFPGALDAVPAAPATASTLAEALQVARTRHPDLTQAQRAVNVAELNISLAEAAMKPGLRATANAGVSEGGNDSLSYGLTFSGPLYRGGGLASSYREASARRDAARAGLHVARLGVEQNVGNAWAQLAVAQAGLVASEEQIRASRVAFQGVREEANLGARTTLDVLNAEQELLDAQAAQISAQSDRYIAIYNLLSAMGLLNTTHLGLNVARYDPAAYYDAVKDAPLVSVSPQGEKLDAILKALGKQ